MVVLDPPRPARGAACGADRRLRPRVIAYVACDPAALARDVAYFAEHGYGLAGLRAFDLFPMTQHVECVATLVRAGGRFSDRDWRRRVGAGEVEPTTVKRPLSVGTVRLGVPHRR